MCVFCPFAILYFKFFNIIACFVAKQHLFAMLSRDCASISDLMRSLLTMKLWCKGRNSSPGDYVLSV